MYEKSSSQLHATLIVQKPVDRLPTIHTPMQARCETQRTESAFVRTSLARNSQAIGECECLAIYALSTLDVASPSLPGDPVEELRSERRKSGVAGAGERAAGDLRREERKGDAAGVEGDGEGRV